MKKVETLKPFTRFLMTIGEIPSSYLVSMTYEEQLLWFCNYLEKTVIPTIDNNAEAVIELQNYVKNYFDNLDVQEEIDNKLDEMVEDGTLDEIINQELFGELNEEITNLQNADTLINNNIDLINSKRTILIGDSYGLYRPGLNINGWQVYLQQILGLSDDNCYKLASSGSGFKRSGDNGTFLQYLTSYASTIQNHDSIKNIIVCGGLNDRIYTQSEIETEIESFINYCKNTYPNAQIYIGHIGNNKGYEEDQQIERLNCLLYSLPAYQNCSKYGGIYLNGVEYIMKDYSNYYDNSHPNDTASLNLAKGIYNAFKNGYCTVSFGRVNELELGTSIVNDTKLPISYNFFNNKLSIEVLTEYTAFFANFTTAQTTNGLIDIGEINLKYYRNIFPWYFETTINAILHLSDNTNVPVIAQLFINEGHLYFRFNNTTGNNYTITAIGLRPFTFTIDGIYC